MRTDLDLDSGKNRALVCYCDCINVPEGTNFFECVASVFARENIGLDNVSGTFYCYFDTPKSALNIALEYNNVAKRLKVGGTFNDVNVGVFFYDQPAPPPQPEPDPDEEPDEEPEPAPSITSLVCDALRDSFGGVYGASAFVVPQDITAFTLEVE